MANKYVIAARNRVKKLKETLTPEELSERMRALALKKHSQTTPKERRKHAKAMVKARIEKSRGK